MNRRRAPGSTDHYRTPPGERLELVCQLTEHRTADGRTNLVGFTGHNKLVAFPKKSGSGWTLFKQPLTRKEPPVSRADALQSAPTVTIAPEARAGFASGLPRRQWGDR